MNDLHVHIESLELIGFERHEGKGIADAIARELTHLLAAAHSDPARLSHISAQKIDAGTIRHGAGVRPAIVGRRIARALHRTLR